VQPCNNQPSMRLLLSHVNNSYEQDARRDPKPLCGQTAFEGQCPGVFDLIIPTSDRIQGGYDHSLRGNYQIVLMQIYGLLWELLGSTATGWPSERLYSYICDASRRFFDTLMYTKLICRLNTFCATSDLEFKHHAIYPQIVDACCIRALKKALIISR
jgi:hypothetical protein